MTRKHYGFRVAQSLVPCVEVIYWDRLAPNTTPGTHVAKRVYGFTVAHAITRAQTWMRAHGDLADSLLIGPLLWLAVVLVTR